MFDVLLVWLAGSCTGAGEHARAEQPNPTPALSATEPAASGQVTPAASANRLECGILQSSGFRSDAERQFFAGNCTTTVADRTSCGAISGTAYRSDAERDWYLANCVVVQTPATPTPRPAVPTERPSPATPQPRCGDAEVTVGTEFAREYFTISGLTLDQLNASLKANGPVTPEGNAAGVTEYTLSIATARCVTAAACKLGLAALKATGRVILPRHTNEASLGADLRPVWMRFVNDVTIHEERHVTIVKDGLEDAKRQLLALPEAPTCADLERTIGDVWRFSIQAIDQRQESFHVADRFGVGGVIVP